MTPSLARLAKVASHATLGLALMAASAAQAVVLDGHIKLSTATGNNTPVKPNLQLTIDQTPEGNYTGATFLHQWGLLKLVSVNIDEGSSWYVVKKGALINASTSSATGAQSIPGLGNSTTTQGGVKVGNDFYLAGLTRTSYTTPPTVFGWVHLRKDIWGRFKIVDAAVAYDETGIVAGTRLTALPTP
jgi:hypothetical protein